MSLASEGSPTKVRWKTDAWKKYFFTKFLECDLGIKILRNNENSKFNSSSIVKGHFNIEMASLERMKKSSWKLWLDGCLSRGLGVVRNVVNSIFESKVPVRRKCLPQDINLHLFQNKIFFGLFFLLGPKIQKLPSLYF